MCKTCLVELNAKDICDMDQEVNVKALKSLTKLYISHDFHQLVVKSQSLDMMVKRNVPNVWEYVMRKETMIFGDNANQTDALASKIYFCHWRWLFVASAEIARKTLTKISHELTFIFNSGQPVWSGKSCLSHLTCCLQISQINWNDDG